MRHILAVLLLVLPLVAVAEPDAGDGEEWSPTDFFNEPNPSCTVDAALPGPGGTIIVGTSCNQLDGQEIGSVVVLDDKGKLDASPFGKAVLAAAERDRMQELAQLIAMPRGGFLATYSSRSKDAPEVPSVHFPAGHRLVRFGPTGALDAAYAQAAAAAFQSKAQGPSVLLDVAVDAEGRALVLLGIPSTDPKRPSLKAEPSWLLRLGPDGSLDRAVRVDELLKALGLGYYEVLQVAPRPSGGAWVSGRFEPLDPKAPGRAPIYLLALDAAWKADAAFNGPFIASQQRQKRDDVGVEVRLLSPGPGDTVVCVGELTRDWKNAGNVFRLSAKGELDPTFQPFMLPGQLQQGRLLHPEVFGPAGKGWLVSYGYVPGASIWPAPGLVRLGVDGKPDADYQKGLGAGLLDAKSAARATSADNSDQHGWTTLLAPLAGGRALVAGHFDTFDGKAIRSPVLLGASGAPEPTFAPDFKTVLPPRPKPVNVTTSAFVPSDGKPHYLRCTGPNPSESLTLMYMLGGDPWGHTPSCLLFVSGDLASPGGGWQHCDTRVRKLKRKGATCTELDHMPLHQH